MSHSLPYMSDVLEPANRYEEGGAVTGGIVKTVEFARDFGNIRRIARHAY